MSDKTPDSHAECNTSSKSKGKKLPKLAKILGGSSKTEVAPSILKHVVDQVNARQSSEDAAADPEAVRAALEQMRIMDILKGKADVSGRGKKGMGEHKFWATQPVPQLGEGPPAEDGHIEPTKAIEDVRPDPYPLPKEFEWSVLDVNDSNQVKELYDLLSMHYVEDDVSSFRFKYSAEFLAWALKPPGYFQDWHVGVRVSSNQKLVAFISGVPATLRVRKNVFRVSEINFLCVHKKLRSKRLAPVLIKEITRRVHLQGIAQAIYTAGVVVPTPVSTCRYHHRSLNIQKLVDTKFTYVPRNMTIARMIRMYNVGDATRLPGMREMEEKHIPQVQDLLERYLQRFSMSPVMSMDEIRHLFLSGRGDINAPSDQFRRPRQVLWAYVVEDPETGRVTDFISFFSLPSTVINHPKHDTLEAAYLFYYATDVAFEPGADESGKLKQRLIQLGGDGLIIAKQAKFDVLNAVTLMDNVAFLEDLKFGAGDGLLNFYLYNWRTAPLAGVEAVGDVPAGRGIGVVML